MNADDIKAAQDSRNQAVSLFTQMSDQILNSGVDDNTRTAALSLLNVYYPKPVRSLTAAAAPSVQSTP